MGWTLTSSEVVDGLLHMTYVDDNGERMLHTAPVDAVEWRVAQYGATEEEAVRMLLAEPFIPHPMDPNAGEDPAAAAGMVVDDVAGTPRAPVIVVAPVHLGNAPTVEEAKEAQLLRVAAAEEAHGLTSASPEVIQAIVDNSPIDPEVVEAKVVWSERMREEVAAEREALMERARALEEQPRSRLEEFVEAFGPGR